MPDSATCGTATTTSISNPPGAVRPLRSSAWRAPTTTAVLARRRRRERVYAFGDAVNFAQPVGPLDFSAPLLNHPIVGIAATPDGKGYWGRC